MRFEHRAALNRALERLPGGPALRHLAQQVKRRAIFHPWAFRWHRDAAERHGALPIGQIRAYEFGAGKELATAVALWCYGMNSQVLVDQERLLDTRLVQRVKRTIGTIGEPFARLPAPGLTLEDMGIDYRAPADARALPFEAASFDLITSTDTLEHVPPEDMLLIMLECRRLIRPGGVLSMTINYSDHNAMHDSRIGRTHFLRYSDAEFDRYQSRFLYQNRMRHSDYRRLFERAGLQVLAARAEAEPGEVEAVRRGPLAERFRGYEPEDLAARYGYWALAPAP